MHIYVKFNLILDKDSTNKMKMTPLHFCLKFHHINENSELNNEIEKSDENVIILIIQFKYYN